MKKMLLLAMTAILLNSCSKNKNDNEPTATSETVKLTDSIKIGNQYWTATNYNGQTGVVFGNATTANPSWGKLYTLDEAKALKLPKGWRLPTTEDFNTLLATMGARTKGTDGNYISDATVASTLMSKTNWLTTFPTNTSGFNAIPAGFFTTERNFVEAAGTSDSFISAVFATSSTYVATSPSYTGPAILYIYQYKRASGTETAVVITAFNTKQPTRTSLRFVRDN